MATVLKTVREQSLVGSNPTASLQAISSAGPEHLLYTQRVTGSNPVSPMSGAVAQLVRALVCHAGGHGFKSRPFRSPLYVNW